MRFLLALLLLSTGCSYEDSRCPNYPIEDFQRLEDELTEAWSTVEDFDLYLGSIVEVQCTDEKPVSESGKVADWGWAEVDAETLTTTIKIRNLPTLRMTAYVHELFHVGLWEGYGSMDADHAEGEGPWKKKHDDLVLKLWGL